MNTDFAVCLRKKLACWDSSSDICCSASKSHGVDHTTEPNFLSLDHVVELDHLFAYN